MTFAHRKETLNNPKKMKTLHYFGALLIGGTILASCADAPQDKPAQDTQEKEVSEQTGPSGMYTVDASKSTVKWEGTMMKVAGASLYSHTGTVRIAEGKLDVKNGAIAGGGVVIDMSTISTTDDDGNYHPENGKGRDALISHLSSPDFFDVANHSVASFDIVSVDGNMVAGNLSIKGVKNLAKAEITKMTVSDSELKLTARMSFDRQDYNIAFSMKNAMDVRDKFIDDTITLDITLVAKAK